MNRVTDLGPDADPGAPPAGCLQVGMSEDMRQVIVNVPCSNFPGWFDHVIFSPDQARAFAKLLEKHASAAEGHTIDSLPSNSTPRLLR